MSTGSPDFTTSTTSARSTSALFVIGTPKSTTSGIPTPHVPLPGNTLTSNVLPGEPTMKLTFAVEPSGVLTFAHRRQPAGSGSDL